MQNHSNKRFVVHFCLTEPHEQIVSVATRLDEPFEVALWQLNSDKVDNVLVGKLRHEDGKIDLQVQGNLQHSGFAFRNPEVVLGKPFSIHSKSFPNAVIVTQPMDRTLEYQIDRKCVSVPSERANLASEAARCYLDTVRTEMLKARKAQLESELIEVDGKLKSENHGNP